MKWMESHLSHPERPMRTGHGAELLLAILPSQLAGEARQTVADHDYLYEVSIDGALPGVAD